MNKRLWLALPALAALSFSTLALAQSKEIRIAHIYSKTGPLEAYGKQTQTGFVMGLGPRQTEKVGEEPLRETVPAHDLLGERRTRWGELDAVVVDRDQRLVLQPADHLRHRRTGHVGK